jgi:methionine synthase II (cobalamin-independent)
VRRGGSPTGSASRDERVAYDEYYHDPPKMMMDLSKLLRRNFLLLADAGCRNIQIDEPLFTMAAEAAVDAINTAIEDLPDTVHVSMHICRGNYAVGKSAIVISMADAIRRIRSARSNAPLIWSNTTGHIISKPF